MDSDFKFQYWEELGRVKATGGVGKEALEIPLHLGFNPASTYTSPLGYQFEFALFDSRLVWESDTSVKMHLPDGNVEPLSFAKGKNTLRGAGWLGEFQPRTNQVTLKASCNWVLNFTGNRLASLRSPDGVTLTVTRHSNGTLQLNRGGIPLVTLTPNWDKQSVQKFYHLKFADKTAILKMGQRPVIVREKDKSGKIVMLPALCAVRFNGETEKNVIIESNKMTISKHLFVWNDSNRLLENDGKKYSFKTIMGVKCLVISFPDGKTQLKGSSANRGLVITQSGEEKILVEEHYTNGPIEGKVKRASWLLPDGNLDTFQQYWYDENGVVIRKILKGDEGNLIFWKDGNRFFAKKENNKNNFWEKEYDNNGRLTELLYDGKRINFFYGDPENVKIVISSALGVEEFFYPYSKLTILTNTFLNNK
jgi:hypothetical protein